MNMITNTELTDLIHAVEETSTNCDVEFFDPLLQSSYQQPEKTDDEINNELKRQFLTPGNEISWNILDLVQKKPDFLKNSIYDSLLSIPEPDDNIILKFKRRGIKGSIDSYSEELDLTQLNSKNTANSLSMNRKFGSKKDAVKGKTTQLPFMPGGFIMEDNSPKHLENLKLLHKDKDGLYDLPNGLPRGLEIGNDTGVSGLKELEDSLNDVAQYNFKEEAEDDIEDEVFDEAAFVNEVDESSGTSDESSFGIDGLLPENIIVQKNHMAQTVKKKEWAHMIDLDHKIENFHELVPNMAREWPFELDTFQKEAIYHLEQNDSVFVAAHTSAGKTVVAEYAIAMANRNMTKAIYTSPIKALSNQKFRDFKEDFTDIDVGLITGDVQINPTANCLIMTTEILRSMLYRGSDLIRDVEFVIFDEVHYVNDIDRGVVWEEVIIMLPPHVKFILLSATVPNTFEFANWVGRTKQKDIYVISTPKRPTPLEIYGWAKDDIFKIIDAKRTFLEDGFRKHKDRLEGNNKDKQNSNNGRGGRGGASRGGAPRGGAPRGGGRGGVRGSNRGGRGGGRGGALANNNSNNRKQFMNRDSPNKKTWLDLVQYLKKKDLLPAVVFVFSKKRCEEYIDTLTSIDYTTAKEKSEIHRFFEGALSRLRKEDRNLPQILKIRDMASRGIAVHHGGLLPIIKEIIEILFSKSLVKVLFATETFAMGLNLPTRTVVFSELRKHDGTKFRNLLPGEFTQMSGRAGRRGLDKIGTVIVMAYNLPFDVTSFKEVTLGVPTKLSSQFRLTYNMILNLLRIEALRVEEMIKRSFSENSTQSMMSDHMENAKKLETSIENSQIDTGDFGDENAAIVQDLFAKFAEYKSIITQMITSAMESPVLKKKFATGRMIIFRDHANKLRPGFITKNFQNAFAVLQFNMGSRREGFDERGLSIPYLSMVNGFIESMGYPKIEFGGHLKRVTVFYDQIELVTRNNASKTNEEFTKKLELLLKYQKDWGEINWDGFLTLSMHDLMKRKDAILDDLRQNSKFLEVMKNEKFIKNYKIVERQQKLRDELRDMQMIISGENLELLPDYNSRLEVLKDLGFIDFNLNVQLKGRVACEVNSGWELIVTELVLDNFLGEFEPEEIVALLSCFIYEGRGNNSEEEEPFLTPRLEKGEKRIKEIVGNVLDTYQKHQVGLTSEEENFLERKRFSLVNVVYEWARGMPFSKIMEMSPESEGTIVRVITRLDEVCREVKNAASIIGNSSLHGKMTESQEKIKRDIVFCASLYL
ncbi:SKI complex RNA helicase subunit [Saccharomycopsis crataegensis]|uniref:SKI complex RNA helicase subunit n=1 Tax=Saccharomycopsis crataegensis TaxID=43959 RepID=A0AAV5QHW4_9ASCO|nr:SKI complex RNA helicase subunit [Saccharomycopsis crataegensis]